MKPQSKLLTHIPQQAVGNIPSVPTSRDGIVRLNFLHLPPRRDCKKQVSRIKIPGLMKYILTSFFLVIAFFSSAQLPDHIYHSNIRSVKLYNYGDMYSYPVMTLNSNDQIELHFDDLDADSKNYYYTYQ